MPQQLKTKFIFQPFLTICLDNLELGQFVGCVDEADLTATTIEPTTAVEATTTTLTTAESITRKVTFRISASHTFGPVFTLAILAIIREYSKL